MLQKQIVMHLVIINVEVIVNHNPSGKFPIPTQLYFETQVHKDGDLETEPMLRLNFILPLE
jgi:hypothetical protein